MVTKNKTEQKKGNFKVGKLKLNKEAVENLSNKESKQVRAGAPVGGPQAAATHSTGCPGLIK